MSVVETKARENVPSVPLERPLLEVKGLVKHFSVEKEGWFERPRVLRAVDGVDFFIRRAL